MGGGKYGLLVEVMDSKDLKNKMVSVAKSKELMEKYSKLSSERAKVFNLSKFLNEWVELIENKI